MEFDDSIEERRVRVSEGGHDILTLQARVSYPEGSEVCR
jgi:hypothetical protein